MREQGRFIHVEVEEHEALPDGCSMRFHGTGQPFTVERVRYESEDGREGIWLVHAAHADGTRGAAMGSTVEDSSAGSSTLVYGGAHGLRLVHEDGGDEVAEPYLLLAPSAII
ncbi:hypothetical protein LZC95_13055 [Pendulispora brunnea]|uniref:Uncharacterized protein n=1 Tax=Pendulispora brunnea TaxID=2905690 RepID=A0ABZ2KIA3_9BACT